MKRINKILTGPLAALMLVSLLAGCKKADTPNDNGKQNLRIVTTIFPAYDWVRAILGDQAEQAELTLLLDSGVDLHSYQPTAADMIRISDCDLFVYVGGASDKWMDDALKAAANQDRKVINLLEVLGSLVKNEEAVEGMQEEAHDHGAEEEPEADEHVWLSLKNAQTLCAAISQALQELDPSHKEDYDANTAAYLEKLTDLDTLYQKAVDGAARKTLLFADRFPFRYLVDDYGLNYYAAFSGCSAESEASFDTVSFLAKKVDKLGLPCVLTIEGTQHRIAETIVKNTTHKNQTILRLDSMQSTTSQDVQKGATYLSIMERNLDVLKEALG